LGTGQIRETEVNREKADEDAQHSIIVRELPPVSITKDWGDWGVWAFSLLLAMVGLLQIVLLFRTWKTIERQANHMATSERPWLIATVTDPRLPTEDEQFAFATMPTLENKGSTPAFLIEIGNAVSVLKRGESLPTTPQYAERDIIRWDGHGVPLAPGGHVARGILHTIDRPLGLRLGETVLWVYGYVKYRDAFMDDLRETRYCFRCQPSMFLGGGEHHFTVDGPPAYLGAN
jgi:hypothetical protein